MASKEQKEGIARVFDTLAASCIIAAVVGFSGHSIITVAQIVALCVLAPILLALAWNLRKPQK